MKLKSIYISQYKNLKGFDIIFDEGSFVDVFVGKNATGKSNFFEALLEIFRHLYESKKTASEIDFEYEIKFEKDEKDISIAWSGENFKVNGKIRKTINKGLLPDNVLIYYSGHNNNVEGLLKKYEVKFRKQIKGASLDSSRQFLGIDSEYKELLLSILLMQPESSRSRQYIMRKLKIEKTSGDAKLVLKRPPFANNRLKKQLNVDDIDPFDSRTRYWGLEGTVRDFLDNLTRCIKGEFSYADLYYKDRDIYKIPIEIELFRKEFSDRDLAEVFRYFDSLKVLGIFDRLLVPIKLKDGREFTTENFSDGQFQSIYIYSIIELFKDKNCVILLDEPDSFLHPEWQFEFLKQIFDITDDASKHSHILMSSHSPATLCSLENSDINLFKVEGLSISCVKQTKREIINELSNSFIQYSEDESKLLIDNVIRSSSRPVLFVEGITDVYILNTAYEKLYDDQEIPILIQDAFGRGFLKQLFSASDIFTNYPEKQFFALFDFDDAYYDWNKLKGDRLLDIDMRNGLCKKLSGRNAHAFLLPIPDNRLRLQVVNEDPYQPFKDKPCFGIEHIFWDAPGLNQNRWFKEDKNSGYISFSGKQKDKVKFAKSIVPTLDVSSFEIFRPIFEFILLKA
jgi:energy-coupling factor transporter ATP-binding protein EcfA2